MACSGQEEWRIGFLRQVAGQVGKRGGSQAPPRAEDCSGGEGYPSSQSVLGPLGFFAKPKE